MGANAKRRKQEKVEAKQAVLKARTLEAGYLPAAASQLCFCGGQRHVYGSRPVAAGFPRPAIRQADGAKLDHSFLVVGRTHGCPLRKGFAP